MFYSHQLLARKAPLGQIWMAATMHAKMNRKKLDKLNIIKICEEILNPAVPMALRLSGILMGGVVIVYERKVKILYDDVNRLLVDINEAWKVKAVPDRTLLPKSKCPANVEAVTLPDNQEDADLGEIENSLSKTKTKMVFQQSGYFEMRLDTLEDPFIDNNDQCHQANKDDITLLDFNPCPNSYVSFNHFERFDIEGDEGMHLHFSQNDAEIPTVNTNSTPNQPKPQKTDEIQDHFENQWNENAENQLNEQHDQTRLSNCTSNNVVVLDLHKPKRRTRKPRALFMDYDQTMIPGNTYQSWLQSTADIVSRRRKERKRFNLLSSMKIAKLMELPPVVLLCGLFATGSGDVYYPQPLLELWRRKTHDSPSVRISSDQQQPPSSTSRLDGGHYNDPSGYEPEPFEDFQSGVGSRSLGSSVEKLRANLRNKDILEDDLLNNILEVNQTNNGRESEEDDVRSIHSSGSARGFMTLNSDTNSGRSSKKRPYSSSKHNGSGLEPVEEEIFVEPNFKMSRLSEDGATPDLLVETGPTQTQKHFPVFDQAVDQMTDCIRMQLKSHFETPGNTQTESLNQLTNGMNRRTAALLFYQTCVLANKDFIRVQQNAPYEDIIISRGPKM